MTAATYFATKRFRWLMLNWKTVGNMVVPDHAGPGAIVESIHKGERVAVVLQQFFEMDGPQVMIDKAGEWRDVPIETGG